MIRAALANAQAAEVDNFIRFDVQDAQAARPNGEHGIIEFPIHLMACALQKFRLYRRFIRNWGHG